MEKKSLFPAVGGFLHGGDYNPEQWLDRPDILEEDIRGYFSSSHAGRAPEGVANTV